MEGASGPMARDVTDLAIFLDAMSGYEPRSPISLEAPATPFRDEVAKADEKLRIAFSEDLDGFGPVEPEIRVALRTAMEKLSGAGMEVEEACPELPGLEETFRVLRGINFGTVNASFPEEVQRHFKATLRDNVDYALKLDSARIFEAYRQRTVLYHAAQTFLDDFDVLAIPVVGIGPLDVEIEFPPSVDGQPSVDYLDWLRFSFLATVASLPAIALPIGLSASGMPVGVQLVGRPRGEAALLRAARSVEVVLGGLGTPIDPIVTTSA
jgi:amidase